MRSNRRPVEDQDDPAATMSFLSHLDELRARLIRASIAIGIGMVVAFCFVDRIADVVESSVIRALPPGSALVFVRPGEAFSFFLDLALIAGVVLAAPYVMYQVWRFVAPALYASERRFVIPFVVLTAICTIAGALFSHFLMFPGMMKFFATFDSPKMKFMPRIEDTFDLYKTTMLGMVLVFQLPTLVFFLAKLGVVTARFLWTHLKYAILAIFVIAAVLTPSSDPWNQTVFALPMVALYVLSIGIAWLVQPRQRDAENAQATLRLVVGAMVVDQARRNSAR